MPQQRQAITPMKTAYDMSHQWMIWAGRSMSQKRIGIAIVALLAALWSAPALAQGTPMPWAIPQFFDANGDPLVSGRLCAFEAGTTTLANTYTTAALTTANANPVVMNAGGWPSSGGSIVGIFLRPGQAYKFILKDATTTTCVPDTGVTIWSVDNVTAVPASDVNVDVTVTAGGNISAGEVAYQADGTGGTTQGRWYRADADAAASSILPMVGFALADVAAGGEVSIRLSGRITTAAAVSAGSSYYISSTAGALTTTAPSLARYVGQADTATTLILDGNPRPVLPGTSTITTTGTQTALVIPGGTGPLTIFANNGTLLTIQGIAAGIDGQQLTIVSKGAGQVDLANQNGSAAAADRIINGVTGTISLAAGSGRVVLEYDTTTARWRVIEHEQGAWITPTFSAGNFTGTGAMTWTVASGDVVTYAYYLKGRSLWVSWFIQTATIGVGADRPVNIAIPGGFTAAKTMVETGLSVDNGGAEVSGAILVQATGTTIGHFATQSSLAGNWNPGADNMSAKGQIVIEVQ